MAKAGTISTVRAGSWTLCSSLETVMAGEGWPSTRANIFDDFCPVGLNNSPIIPAWEVQALSHATDRMEPLRTPTLVCASVSVAGCGSMCGWQGGRGRRLQRELSLSMWSGGRRKRTLGWRWLYSLVIGLGGVLGLGTNSMVQRFLVEFASA